MAVEQFVLDVLALVPVVAVAAPVISIVVDFLKRLGVLPDGYAPLASLALNALAWVLVYAFGEAAVAEYAEPLAQILPAVFGVVLSLLGTEAAHKLLNRMGSAFAFKHS